MAHHARTKKNHLSPHLARHRENNPHRAVTAAASQLISPTRHTHDVHFVSHHASHSCACTRAQKARPRTGTQRLSSFTAAATPRSSRRKSHTHAIHLATGRTLAPLSIIYNGIPIYADALWTYGMVPTFGSSTSASSFSYTAPTTNYRLHIHILPQRSPSTSA